MIWSTLRVIYILGIVGVLMLQRLRGLCIRWAREERLGHTKSRFWNNVGETVLECLTGLFVIFRMKKMPEE